MNPEKIAFEHCDLEEVFAAVHKATQVNAFDDIGSDCSNDIKENSNPDAGIKDKGSVTVLEFTQVLQDSSSPTSITVVRESLTEDIRNHPDNIVTSDGTSNRYRYSKEVIKPYIKLESDKHPSQDKLVSIALDSADKEYPRCQPCNDTNPQIDSEVNKDKNYPPRPDSKDTKKSEPVCPPKEIIETSPASIDKEVEVDKTNCSCKPDIEATQIIKNFCQLYEECEDLGDKKSVCPTESDTKVSDDKNSICQLMVESKNAGKIKILCQLIPDNEGIEVKKPSTEKSFDKISKSTSFTSNMEKKTEAPKEKSTVKPCNKKGEEKKKPSCPPPINVCKLGGNEAVKDEGCIPEKKPEKNPEKDDPCKMSVATEDNELGFCTMKPTIGIIPAKTPEEKPTFCLTETKVYEEKMSPSSISQIQNAMLNAHCQTMATIQSAMEDFFCKICKSTQDAVKVITDESAKHLEKLKSYDVCEPKPKKVVENRSAETVTSYNFFKFIGQQSIIDQVSNHYFKPTDMLLRIVDKVDSVISVIGEKINEKLPALKRNFDSTTACTAVIPPNDVSQVHLLGTPSVPAPNNMFTAIKSRFCSMFSDRDLSNKKSLSSKSSSTAAASKDYVKHDSDDDLID